MNQNGKLIGIFFGILIGIFITITCSNPLDAESTSGGKYAAVAVQSSATYSKSDMLIVIYNTENGDIISKQRLDYDTFTHINN